MYHTHHIQQRMRQRGINQAIIQCVIDFGEIKQDKYLISHNLAIRYIHQIKRELIQRHRHNTRFHFEELSHQDLFNLLKYMKKIADKKGVVVVMDDDTQITTYNLCSFRRIKHQIKKI